MSPEEYASYDGLGLADLVRRREVSRLELVDQAIAIAERRNPEINAICYEAYDQAREEARVRDADPASGGPFDGVPFLLKDLNGERKGWPEKRGSRAMQNYVSPHTDALTARQIGSGLIPVGKSTTPEFGLIGVTESALYGDTRNPWNLEHTPGGSSGGSGASVAAAGTLAQIVDPDRPLITTTAGATLSSVADLMAELKIGCLPVVDNSDDLIGLVTVTDAIKAYAAHLA